MELKLIHSDNFDENDLVQVIELCRRNSDIPNYEVEDWQSKKNSFLHVFLKEKRFGQERGGVVLVRDGEKLCGFSGYYRSSFHRDIYLLGVRTLVNAHYRHKLLMSSHFIPKQIELVSGQAKLVAFTFDLNNVKNIYHVYQKGKLNHFLKNKMASFPYWDRLVSLDYPVLIQGTLQNVLYIKLDELFEFEWSTLTKSRHPWL
jgi:hypothetical protein